MFRDSLPFWRRAGDGGWDDAIATAAEAGQAHFAEAQLAADALARQCQFGEAMHVLLLQSLAALRERLNERFADSLTSREILRSTKLPDRGRTALHQIVARVERAYFGEHPASLSDYDACRANFDTVAEVLRADALG
jgi:hypothetical protein